MEHQLLRSNAQTIGIIGEGGVGKTTLAIKFAHQHASSFPGGIYHVHADAFKSLPGTVSHIPNNILPYLLILDDLELHESQQHHAEVSELHRLRPSAKIIHISRQSLGLHKNNVQIKLSNLNQSEFSELLKILKISENHSNYELEAFKLTQGNPFFAHLAAANEGFTSQSIREIIQHIKSFTQPGIIDANGFPLKAGTLEERRILHDVQLVADDLLAKAYGNPNLLYEITPRRFEEFVAELLARLGYEITLTPASRDGGKDIYAAKKDDLGSFLYVVECKKYAPGRRVGVNLIRELHGVVQAERATAGILATTAFFTKGAKDLQQNISNQISLKDYIGIQEWLAKVFRK